MAANIPSTEEGAGPAARPTDIVVGSTNPIKSNAVKSAFEDVFAAENAAGLLRFHSLSAASNVTDQPMGDEETKRGAANRAANAARAFHKLHGSWPAFAVGLEGGCADTEEEIPVFDPSGPIDSTATKKEKELVCFAFMAVLEPSTGRWGFAKTGTFLIPPAVASLVRSGVELGVADDQVFGRQKSKEKDGAVGLLTKGLIDRAAYYKHAVILALTPFISSSLYC